MSYLVSQQPVRRVGSLVLSKLQLRIEHLWSSLPIFVVTWMGFMHPLRLLDFWWHLKVGEVIFTSGQIPQEDIFSFTQAGRPFVYQNWLGEVLYYLAYRVGGFPLLITLNTLLLLLTFVPILCLCLESTSRRRMAILSSSVAAIVLGLYSNVRPQVYSFVFFAAFYWILWRYRVGHGDFLWALPLLMVLWVNLHGAFVLGIGLLVLLLLSEAVRWGLYGPRADTLSLSALAKLGLTLALVVLATMVNPEGYRVFAYVRQLQVDPASQQFVTEWQVPDIKEPSGGLLFFAPFFLALLVFFYSRCRLSLTELSLFFTFAVLGLGAIRNGIWFALIIAPMLARHLPGLEAPDSFSKLHSRFHLEALARRLKRQQQNREPTRYWLNWVIMVCLLLFTLVLSPWVRPYLGSHRLRSQLVEESTPIGAMDYIAQHHLTGRIFHPQTYGDYLIWRLWPQQRSFFDGRVHLYSESFVRDYILILHDEQWHSRLAKYDVQYLLLPKNDRKFNLMINGARNSEDWKVLYEDEISVLFERQP